MHKLMIYAVTSECSRNHFTADKHKTVQLYKVYEFPSKQSPFATIHFFQ